MKFLKILLLVNILFFFLSCKNDVKSENNYFISKATTTNLKKANIKFITKLIVEVKDDSIENPMSDIILSINEIKYNIAKVPGEGTNMAGNIFPKNAVASCITWWGGSGDFFYAIQRDKNIIVYKGWDGEGNDSGGYNWELIKEIKIQ